MEKKKIKSISLFASFLLFLVIFVNCNENKVYARDEYHNAYDYYQTYGSDSCRFAVVDKQARIYFNAYQLLYQEYRDLLKQLSFPECLMVSDTDLYQ